jgi:pyrrolidone-carboxylate peptidase
MEDLIVVTGYGPFAGHDVNASGEAVKLLPENVKVGDKKYEIKKIHVLVEYDEVDRTVENIWKMRPYLVVHCGEFES